MEAGYGPEDEIQLYVISLELLLRVDIDNLAQDSFSEGD